jgi:hypothetical protein
MMAMYLTDRKNNVSRELHDHEDLEVLLESFAKQVEEIVNEAQNMEVRLFIVEYHNGLMTVCVEQCTIYTGNCGAYSRL